MVYKMETAQKGDKVKVEYVGTLEDGTIFDSTEKHEGPLEFIIGSGHIIQGFDNAVEGMKVGEEKQITLSPKEAYGEYNPELLKELPKEVFPQDQTLQKGMVFMLNLPSGQQVPARISEIKDQEVTIDLNPPLAGKTLKFKIKLLAIAK